MKKLILITILLLGFARATYAADGIQQRFYYLVLPPASTISVNQQGVENQLKSSAQMRFQQSEEEKILVDKQTIGVRVVTNDYTVDVATETEFTLTHILQLNAGSLHVVSQEEPTNQRELLVGDLVVYFHSNAEFLAFVSGEGTETIIKSIAGEITIESPNTQQTATLEAGQATSTDAEGRLLIPFPSQVEQDKGWWNQSAYQLKYAQLPLADAGEDQRVLGNMQVTLDGSRSQFATGDIFEWKLVKAPNGKDGKPITKVAFNTINIVKPIFTPEVNGEYYFSLQITNQDGGKSNLSDVVVFVGKEFLKPIAIFPDVPADHPNNLAITYLYKKNVMKGSVDPETGQRLFRPAATINRVEILKTIFENLKETVPTSEELTALKEDIFLDVKPDHWFAPYVLLAKQKGIVKGNNGLYRPADDVVLVEAIKMIVEASKFSIDAYRDETQRPYPDAEKDAWYNPYLFFVKKYELFDPDEEGNIHPGKKLSRAEFAEIIYRIESVNLQEKRGFVSGKVINAKTRTGIKNADVFIYKALQEGSDTDSFVTKGELYDKVPTNSDGSFTISLPIHSKFYLEAITEENISTNKIITEVKEDEVKTIELNIEGE